MPTPQIRLTLVSIRSIIPSSREKFLLRGNQGDIENGLPEQIFAGKCYICNAIPGSRTESWSVAYGLRVSAFSILGKGDYYTFDTEGKVTDTFSYNKGEIVKTYINPEPRLAVSYQLNNSSVALKHPYTRNTQNLHLISNSTPLRPPING